MDNGWWEFYIDSYQMCMCRSQIGNKEEEEKKTTSAMPTKVYPILHSWHLRWEKWKQKAFKYSFLKIPKNEIYAYIKPKP